MACFANSFSFIQYSTLSVIKSEGPMAEKIAIKREYRNRSADVLKFIAQYKKKEGRAPTEREIADAVGLHSTSGVHRYLNLLSKMGKLDRKEKSARGLSLPVESKVKISERNTPIPGLGNIAAGIPIMVPGQGSIFETAQVEIEIPESYLPLGISSQDVFALHVVGDSMRDAMIMDGDTVLVHKTQSVRSGDIVVAWILEEDTTTLKRIRFSERGLWLEPENPSSEFRKAFFEPDKVEIQGKVLGVLRLYR